MAKMSRAAYANIYGPTRGDLVRLADTSLLAEVEHDFAQNIAKYTINPSRAAGIDHYVGSIEPGKMADFVIWPRASFGIKPFLVIKGGFVTWSAMGDGNGSIFMAEPMVQRPMWGALGRAKNALSADLRRARRRQAAEGGSGYARALVQEVSAALSAQLFCCAFTNSVPRFAHLVQARARCRRQKRMLRPILPRPMHCQFRTLSISS